MSALERAEIAEILGIDPGLVTDDVVGDWRASQKWAEENACPEMTQAGCDGCSIAQECQDDWDLLFEEVRKGGVSP